MPKPNLPPPTKKEPTKKSEFTHLPTHSVAYSCVCGAKFETTSASAHNFSVSSCSQCNPFYTGTSVQQVKVGAVARFRQKFDPQKKS